MNDVVLETMQVGTLRMRVAMQGSGPLVLLCHGFPELWHSWRHQLTALAQAGYRAVAPDMRGVGGTDAPADVDKYTMLHLVGDLVELVRSLGERRAAIVGNDWGASVALTAAMMRPDLFDAVVSMGVPFSLPASVDMLSALEGQGIHTFYMQYFEKPGLAEGEFEKDARATIRRVVFSMSGDGPGGVATVMKPGARFLDTTVEPSELPAWLAQEDVDYAGSEYGRTGFRGGLNWYRNIRRSTELLTPWRGCTVRQPSLFIAGSRDDVLAFPGMQARVERQGQVLPGLRGCHVLEGAGHWIQRERTEQVNALLIDFLRSLERPSLS
jgi:pimeloyl-ACP methyl ester carboxylesterase